MFVILLNSLLQDLQAENTELTKVNNNLTNENEDYHFLSQERLRKQELRARIVDNVKRLQKKTGEDWNECWRRLYKRFLQNHNNINLFNVGSKLEYLVNHGYGEELLRTALEI